MESSIRRPTHALEPSEEQCRFLADFFRGRCPAERPREGLPRDELLSELTRDAPSHEMAVGMGRRRGAGEGALSVGALVHCRPCRPPRDVRRGASSSEAESST